MALAAASPIDTETYELRQHCDMRLSELKLDRTGFEPDWHEIAHHIVPHRGRWLAPLSPRRPRRSGQKIIDPTGTKAHQQLAAFCMAGITNPSLTWFRLGVGDDALADDPDVKAYLSECQKRLSRVFSVGNFYTSMHQTYEEIGGFATGAMLCLPDFEDVMRFHPLTAGEYFLALNDRGEVDTLYREYSLTVLQIVKKFRLQNCSEAVKSMYGARRFSGLVIVVHAIEPNRNQQLGKIGWRGKAYTSFYYERGISDRFLRQEGYSVRPFIAPRWSALAGDAYGQGPGHWALPDVKSLQTVARQLAEASEKLVTPPMQGDARHQQAYLGLLPGDINWISGLDANQHAGLRPVYTVPPNVSVMQEEKHAFQETIKSTFFNDLILAISQMEGVQPRNEMEINERRNEKMLMLGPMLERFYTEALSPVIRIVFDVMQRGRLLPTPPKALHGRQVEPAFISVLAQAQKAVGTTSLEQFIRFIGGMAAAWPDALDNVNSDAITTEYASDLEVSPKLLRTPEAVAQLRASKAAQQQRQELLQATPALAQGAKTIAGMAPGGALGALQQQSGQ